MVTAETVETKISVAEAARRVAEEVLGWDDDTEGVYIFPSDSEMRFIYVDPASRRLRAGETPLAFCIGKDMEPTHREVVGTIHPEDIADHNPPEEWGTWKQATFIPSPSKEKK